MVDEVRPLISAGEFINRFTNAEYRAIEAKRAADIAAGNAGFSKRWDSVVFDGMIEMERQRVQTLKADLVAAGVLTQIRADEIFI